MTLLGYATAGLAVTMAAAAAMLFTPLGDRPLAAVFSVGTVPPVDFATLQRAGTPNDHLVCPPGLCAAAADGQAPAFAVPVDRLRAAWQDVLAGEPRVETLAESGDGMQVVYVQRSARLRFPDIVTVRFIALSGDRATLAVYSRSLYGRSDFGVNRARVERWLAQLAATLPAG